MKNDDIVRSELNALLLESNAHMTFEEAVADFPVHRINAKAPHMPYSAWQILEHMRRVQWDIAAFVLDPEHVSPPWPQGYFPLPSESADEADWRRTIDAYLKDRAQLKKLISDSHLDLFAPIPHARDYTIFREILLAADHNAYHTGELAFMRQVLQAWPQGKELYDAQG